MDFFASLLDSSVHWGKFSNISYGAKEMELHPRDIRKDCAVAGGSKQAMGQVFRVQVFSASVSPFLPVPQEMTASFLHHQPAEIPHPNNHEE